MNCNEIRELISCMLDHELSEADSAVVTEHLAHCPECMRVFEAFQAISMAMEDLEEVPAGFTEDVMARIEEVKPAPKKRRGGILRFAGIAGMAACLALVLMTGTRFASTHMYVGGGEGETANYVHIRQATPTPTIIEDTNTVYTTDTAAEDRGDTDAAADPIPADIGDAVSQEDTDGADGKSEQSKLTIGDLLSPEATLPPEAMNMAPSAVPEPLPAVTPTPMPPMDLLFTADLLLVSEEAAADRFTEGHAYEVTVTDESGTEVHLKLWIDGNRIYCKNEAAGTAWYTIGTPAQLTVLLGQPLPTPAAEPTQETE